MKFFTNLVVYMFTILCSSLVFASQPVELVVPYSPGGGTDLFARAVQRSLIEHRLDTVVVYKPGAEGRIGVKYVLTKADDLPTAVVSSTGIMLFNKVFYQSNEFDYTQFDTIAPMAEAPYVLSVSNKSGIGNLKEFFEYAQTKPINCGTSTSAGALYLRYLFKSMNMPLGAVISFKGASESTMNVVAGNIECSFDPWPVVAPNFRNSKLKVISSAGNKPISDHSGIPLLKNHIKDFVITAWFGISIPKSSRFSTREQLISLTQQLHKDKNFVKTIQSLDYEIAVPLTDPNKWLDIEYHRHEFNRQRIGIDKIQ